MDGVTNNTKKENKMISDLQISKLQKELLSDGIKEKYEDDYEYLGLRVTDSDYNDYDAQTGDTLEPSHVWVDNARTDELLDGTCAIGLDYPISRPVDYNGYPGDKVLLLGSNHTIDGEDESEIIMTDPVVLGVLSDIVK
jgi:hypothetical protein